MKKILSLLAVVTLLMSMFSGVVMAAPRDCVIVLDRHVVEYRGDSRLITISGSIVYEDTEAVARVDNRVYISGLQQYGGNAENGRFSFQVFGNLLSVGNYSVVGEDSTEINITNGPDDSFRVVPEITINSSYDLNFEFPVKKQVVLQGGFPNGDGNEFDVEIGYIASDGMTMLGSPIARGMCDEDTFGFLFSGSLFDRAGEIGLFANDILVVEGKVSPAELDVTVSPTTVPRALGDQPITFDFNLDNEYVQGDGMDNNYLLRFSTVDPDGITWDSNKTLVDDSGRDFDDEDKQKITHYIDCDDWDSGEAELIVQLRDTYLGTVIKEKIIELDVVDPDKYTLIGWGLDNASVGDIKLALPDQDTGNFTSSAVDQKVEITEYYKGSTETCKFIELIVRGCGLDEIIVNYGENADSDNIVILSPEQTGELSLTINVYSSETDTSPNATFKKVIDITGYNVSYSPKTIEVDSNRDFMITVTDEKGNPVNNAVIKLGGITVVNGAATNIYGGQYVYENDEEGLFENVGTLDLKITGYHYGKYQVIDFEDAIEVVGKEVYSVSSDVDVLVNGTEEYVYVTVVDRNGDMVYPTFQRIDIDKDGNRTAPKDISSSGYTDLDKDGVKEAAKIRIEPTNDQAEMIIRASTDNGKQMGQVVLEVKPPQVNMSVAESATENIKTEITFEITDPRDGSVLDSDVYFLADPEYVDYTLKEDDGSSITVINGKSRSTSPNSDDEYSYTLFVNDVDWDKAEDDKEDIVIGLFIESGTNDIKMLDIPVRSASLTSDPETIVVGSSAQLTLTYVDGDGDPLEGYAISYEGEEIGETNELGQVYYSSMAATATTLDFEAETDDRDDEDSDIDHPHDDNTDTIVTELSIRPGVDTRGPVATAPETVSSDSVVITISDPGRVQKALINGKPVDIFFPMPKVTHIASVKKGENTFVVEAIDSNGNYGRTVLKVNYGNQPVTPPVDPPVNPPAGSVTFTIGEESKYGVPELKNGTTMVPVRFAESLGAKFAWEGSTKTATYTLGDIVISVSVGKNIAKVNGENVLMAMPAYLNSQNRMVVPLRLIATELGYKVNWTSNSAPISIVK